MSTIRSEAAFGFMIIALIIIFGPLVAQKLRLPGLIGLLIGGAIIGPHMLGVLNDFSSLQATGDIGVLYLIFLAGLGLDMKTFQKYSNVAVSFGLITSVIPWVLGTMVALNQGYDTKAAVLIGSFWASFTLVSYSAVTKYGLTRNASMAATVGASSITDTIGLVTLALIVGSETGDSRGLVLILKIAAGLVLLAAYSMILLPAVTRWFFAGLGRERELRFMMILAGFASAAVVAELLGIESLIGAFFAGLGLNRLVPNKSPLMARTDFFGNALFIPAFLVSVGLLVDPAVMFLWSTLRIAIGLAVALLVGKAAAAWITGKLYKYSKAEVGLVFSLSAAQAAATLASTVIGFEIGLYGDEIVNAVMVVIVVSLFVSGLGSSHYAPRVEPSETTDQRIGETIILPVSHGVDMTNSLWLAGEIAELDGGVVVPLAVATDEAGALEARRADLVEVDEQLRGLGLDSEPELRIDRSVAGGVDSVAQEKNGSLVLLTWPGRQDIRRLMFGGTNDEIAATTDRPIVAASLGDARPERILGFVDERDLEPGPIHDLRMAIDVASRLSDPSHVGLAVDPIDVERLSEAGIDLPDEVTSLTGPENKTAWLDEHATETDLAILPAAGNPFDLVERLHTDGRSIAAVTTRQEAQWYSAEGAIGVTLPRH